MIPKAVKDFFNDAIKGCIRCGRIVLGIGLYITSHELHFTSTHNCDSRSCDLLSLHFSFHEDIHVSEYGTWNDGVAKVEPLMAVVSRSMARIVRKSVLSMPVDNF